LEVSLLDRRRLTRSGYDAPAEPLTLAPFLNLAREISALFVPLKMRSEFRASLEESLLAASQQQIARRTLALDPLRLGLPSYGRLEDGWLDRRWVVGAAVGSAVSIASIASIVAIVWRHRSKAA
jgi:hypothetical protein